MNSVRYQDIFFNIEKFKLQTRNIVHGFITGIHKSPFQGFSVEFSDHRPYNNGDSVDHIDWKLYAKTNRYFIKRYEDETNVPVYIILDHSKSMSFSSEKHTNKLDYAKMITASLSYLALKQRDAVGLITINQDITSFLPAKSRQNWIDQIIKNLNLSDSTGITKLSECLHKSADILKKRNLIIIVSDFLEETNEFLSALSHFKYNMNDLILVNVNDLKELNFDYDSALEIYDLESDEMINANAFEIKKEYNEFIRNHYKTIEDETLKLNYDYINFTLNYDYSQILAAFLNKRKRM
jgi:uncharacterized protein (DUF58 family)